MNCKKDKDNGLDADGLPKATQTGRRIFACKINGQNWVSSSNSRDMNGWISKEALRVWGGGSIIKGSIYERLSIEINDFGRSTRFRLDSLNERYIVYRTNKNCFDETGGYGVAETKSYDGEVIFTRIDSVAKIISGTFWCNIPTDKCDTLKITHGRFDIRYY